ncbi:hypothetical protein [Nocardia sp. NPDC004711]
MSVISGNTPGTQNTAASTTPALVITELADAPVHPKNKGPEHLSAI